MKMERLMEVLRETYSLYGFTPLDTPVIESAEVLLANLNRWVSLVKSMETWGRDTAPEASV